MSENIKECQEKFHNILDQLLKSQNKNIRDDSYLEKIISELSKNYKDLLKSTHAINFLDEITKTWNESTSSKIALFTLKLLGICCENEWQFASIRDKNILDRVQTGLSTNEKLRNASMRLAHVHLLRSLSKHNMGLHYIKQSQSWKLVIKYYEENHTVYVLREAGLFLYDILEKSTELMNDEELCVEIIETILSPLLNYSWEGNDEDNVLQVNDQNDQRIFTPMLNVVANILEMCLASGKRTRIAYYIIGKYRLEYSLWRFSDITHDHLLIGDIMRCQVLSNFLRLSSMDIPPDDDKITDLDFKVFAVHFYNQITYLISRKSFKNIIKAGELNHKLWKMLKDRAPSEDILDDQKIKFGDQVLVIQVLPILFVFKSRYVQDAEYVDEFCHKIFDISCVYTTRILYAFRDALVANGNYDIIAELAAKSIQGMLSTKDALKRERAILAFSILIYLLKEYVPECKENEQAMKDGKTKWVPKFACTELLLQTPNLLSAILSGLYDLIKNYDITWKECFESTLIVNLTLALLNNPNLSTRLAVQALKLTQISIEHYLAPNLALLLNTMEGSGMEYLGPMIAKRLHDTCWEVRDSTLELLTSVVEMSEMKYPAFQKHVLDSNICPIVDSVARNDTEMYVRASAFKCMRTMIQIKLFWECYLSSSDLEKYLIHVLRTESEGIVRKEAVTCITAIYSYQQINKSNMDQVFACLVHAAVNDFHWEVKLNALLFWRMVVCRQFQHQGMIDGTFPTVTFSKEHKKIVTLTNKEILLRLKKVLNELSLRGCLGVLLACLGDDSDFEVVRLAVILVKKIMSHLNKYNYLEEHKKSSSSGSDLKTPLPFVDTNYSEHLKDMASLSPSQKRNNADFENMLKVAHKVKIEEGDGNCCFESVIDSIVNLDDIGILADVYKNNMKLNDTEKVEEDEVFDDNLYKQFMSITTDQFLHSVSQMDFDKLVGEKMNWFQKSESFVSLLDDILLSFGIEESDNNEIDCY